MMFKNYYWLGVGLMTLVAFGLTVPSVPAQVYPLPDAGGATWQAESAAMDRNNNIYAVGSGGTTATEFIAASLTGNGAVNTAFGGGAVTTKVGTYPEYTGPAVCAIQMSGTSSMLLSAGGYYNSKGSDPGVYAALVRYNANGTLDTTFGAKGIVASTTFPAGIVAMAVNPKDNTILVAGSANAWVGGGIPLGLARYTASGKLDTTFNKTGVLTFSPPGVQDYTDTDVAAIELQSDGQIVMAVNLHYASEPTVAALMRFTSTGQLDTTFGSGGIATFPVPPGDTGSVVYDIIVDGDDNIITSGISIGSNGTELMLTCFTPGGALDTTFGESSGTPGVNTGYVTESFGTTPRALALDVNGNIVIAGYATPNTNNLYVARFTLDGALDTTFGLPDPSNPGQSLGYNDSVAGYATRVHHSVQIQGDGTIDVLANPASGGNTVVLQFNSNGTNAP